MRIRAALLLSIASAAAPAHGDSLLGRRLVQLVQPYFAGPLEVGSVEGDLSSVSLGDVVLRDPGGAEAVRARRVRIALDPAALLGGRLRIARLLIDGIELRARTLPDGRANLSALLAPGGAAGPKLEVAIDQAVVQGGRLTTNEASATFQIEAHGAVGAAGGRLTIDRFAALLETPVQASLEGRGAIVLGADGARIEGAELSLATDGDRLERLVAPVRPIGPWRVAASFSGPLAALAWSASVLVPKGRLDASGTLDLTAQPLAWRIARAQLADLDPAACFRGAPAGRAAAQATGAGAGGGGVIDVAALSLDAPETRLRGHGRLTLPSSLEGVLDVTVGDLGHLAAFGLPGLRGALKAHASLGRKGGRTRIEADLRGSEVELGPARAASLDGKLQAIGESITLRVAGKALALGTLRFDQFTLGCDGSRKTVALHLAADGAAHLALDAHGARLKAGGELTGVDGTLDKLELSAGGERWQSSGAAPLRAEGGDLQLRGLVVSSGSATAALALRLRAGRLDGQLTVGGVDARRIGVLLGLPRPLPETTLAGRAQLGGTVGAPSLAVDLAGGSQPYAPLELPALDHKLTARWQAGRLRGSLASRGGAVEVAITLDLPTRAGDKQKLALDATARGLPLALGWLGGAADASAHLGGTLERPELDARITASRLALGPSQGSATVTVGYRGATLRAALDGRLGPAGRVGGDLTAALDLAALWRGKARDGLERLPLRGRLTCEAVDLGDLSGGFAGAGSGSCGFALGGSRAAPRLTGQLGLRGVQLGFVDGLDASVKLAWDGAKAQLDADLTRGGQPLGKVAVGAALPVERVFEAAAWRALPLSGSGEVAGYDLARLAPGLRGQIRATAALTGRAEEPRLALEAAAAGLVVGAQPFASCQAHARFDGSRLDLSLDARERSGGSLELAGSRAADGRWSAELTAHAFAVDWPAGPRSLAGLRSFSGLLDGHLAVDREGARGQLALARGALTLDEGAQQALPGTDALPYQDLALHAALDGARLRVSDLHLTHGGGTLVGKGFVVFERLRARSLHLELSAAALPLQLAGGGVWGAWVDADLILDGDFSAEPRRWSAVVGRGGARLPRIDLEQERALQAVGPLPDVVLVARRGRGPLPRFAAAAAPVAAPAGERLHLQASLPGPFHLRSPEDDTALSVDLDLHAEVTLDSVGARTVSAGEVEAASGTAKLFGRAYAVERARLYWSGEGDLDPTLDLRASREIADATIVLEVAGTLSHPALRWFSEPPIYSAAQVERIIASGDTGSDRDDPGAGALSALVARQLKSLIAPRLALFDVVRAAASDQLDPDPTGLEIGKYLTEKLYLSYLHQFATLSGTRRVNTNQLQIEYRLARHLLVEALYGDASVFGLDLSGTLRY